MTHKKRTYREIFHTVSGKFTHVPERMKVYPRTFADFAPLPALRNANFEQWQTLGFDRLRQQGLAKVLFDRSDFAIFVQTKTANNATLDVMIAAFPHGKTPRTHMAYELPPNIQDDFFAGINTTLQAIQKSAAEMGQQLMRIYISEQFFVDEQNTYPFKKTFEQTHFHITGVTKQDFDTARKPTYEEIYGEDQTRHVFRDPTILVAHDLYRELFPGETVSIDMNTASLIIGTEPLGEIPAISEASRQKYNAVMAGYRQKYLEFIACFTRFEKDTYDRNVPLPRDERLALTNKYIKKHPALSEESQGILLHIADALRPFQPDELYRTFYNNFAGHIGWTFNMEDKTAVLRFAPRIYTESHGYGETDGVYFVIKDRSIQMSDKERKQLLDHQRLLISHL